MKYYWTMLHRFLFFFSACCSVTAPHKQWAIKCVDKNDPAALVRGGREATHMISIKLFEATTGFNTPPISISHPLSPLLHISPHFPLILNSMVQNCKPYT